MPLLPGRSGIGPNIKELAVNSKTGQPRPMEQRIAIALEHARETGADIPGPRYGGKHKTKAAPSGPKRYGGKG